MERHPLLRVRKKYIKLMESKLILKNRSLSNEFVDCGKTKLDLDLDSAE